MGFMFFVAIIVVVIILVQRNKALPDDSYQRGYWDGYRALSAKVQQEFDQPKLNRQAVQSLLIESPSDADEVLIDNQINTTLYDEEPEVAVPVYDPSEYRVDDNVARKPAMTQKSVTATSITPEARSLRNMNVILYMASFLLVAAGALFVGAAVPDAVKLVGVWVIVGVFYAVGYGMHKFVARLRPAAMAFLGTGLALIPFAGFALNQYTSIGAESAWAATSIIGIIAYFVAAIRLQSQLVSYLTVAFVLSLVGSSSAVASMSLTWQFVAFIGVSLIASMVALAKPKWMPKVFSQPIEQVGQYVTPIVLATSLVVGDQIQIAGYEIIFTVATAYYIVVWLQTRSTAYESVVRGLASVTLAVFAWDVFAGFGDAFAATILLLAALQMVYSLWLVNRSNRRHAEYIWLTLMTFLQIATLVAWTGGTQESSLYLTIGLLVIGMMNVLLVLRLRESKAALVTVGASAILPFVVVRNLFQPNLPQWVMIAWFMAAAVIALIVYAQLRHRSSSVRTVMTTSYILYASLALFVMLGGVSAQVATMTLLGLAGFSLAVSYVAKRPYVQLLVSILLLSGVVSLSEWLRIEYTWRPLFIGGIVAAGCWILAIVQAKLRQSTRLRIMIGSGQFALLIIVWGLLPFTINEFADKVTIGVLLLAAIASLGLRALWKTQPATSQMFVWSYSIYAILAVASVGLLTSPWIILVAGIVTLLSLIASYVERLPSMQIATGILTVITVGAFVDLITIPTQWYVLATFGGSALLFYVGAVVHMAYGQFARRTIMVSVGQIVLLLTAFGVVTGDQLATQITCSIMLATSIVSLLLYWRQRDSGSSLSMVWMLSYVLYFVAGLVVSASLSPIWGVVVLFAGSVIFWLASYAERAPWTMAIGNGLFTVALLRLWGWLEFDDTWALLVVSWVAAGLLYGTYWLLGNTNDAVRRRIMLWSTWIVLALATLSNFFVAEVVIAAAATLAVLAVTIGIDAYQRRRFGLVEAMVYVITYSLQRIIEFSFPVPVINLAGYAHWWALTIAVVALVRRTHKQRRFIIAMTFVTLSSGLFALVYSGGYQLLFLVEHLALLIAGALLSRSWATWWGVTAVTLSVLYFLRDYTFLWLGFLGLMMIGIVVWRLMRSDKIDVAPTKKN